MACWAGSTAWRRPLAVRPGDRHRTVDTKTVQLDNTLWNPLLPFDSDNIARSSATKSPAQCDVVGKLDGTFVAAATSTSTAGASRWTRHSGGLRHAARPLLPRSPHGARRRSPAGRRARPVRAPAVRVHGGGRRSATGRSLQRLHRTQYSTVERGICGSASEPRAGAAVAAHAAVAANGSGRIVGKRAKRR